MKESRCPHGEPVMASGLGASCAPCLESIGPHPTGQCPGGCIIDNVPLYGGPGVVRCQRGEHQWRVERLG